MKETELLKKEVEKVERVEKEALELDELLKISETEKDQKDLEEKINDLEREIDALEFQTLLGGDYDKNDVILSIHSGAEEWMPRIGRKCCFECIFASRKKTILRQRF